MQRFLCGMAVPVKVEAVFRDKGTGTITSYIGNFRNELGSGYWKVLKVEGNRVTIELTDLDGKNPAIHQITLVDNDHLKFKPPEGKQELTFARVKQQQE